MTTCPRCERPIGRCPRAHSETTGSPINGWMEAECYGVAAAEKQRKIEELEAEVLAAREAKEKAERQRDEIARTLAKAADQWCQAEEREKQLHEQIAAAHRLSQNALIKAFLEVYSYRAGYDDGHLLAVKSFVMAVGHRLLPPNLVDKLDMATCALWLKAHRCEVEMSAAYLEQLREFHPALADLKRCSACGGWRGCRLDCTELADSEKRRK